MEIPQDQGDVDVSRSDRGWPLPRRSAGPPRHPSRHLLPAVADEVSGSRRALRADPPGPRLFRGALRLSIHVRQVRPALRAGIFRRRDGERRMRHLHRVLHFSISRDRRRSNAALRDPPPRDVPHVVWRPRDDALVGRPVAQRDVRHIHGQPGQRRGNPIQEHLDLVRDELQSQGEGAGPASHHTPDRRGHSRRRIDAPQFRRHHLREGRRGPEAAGRLGR